MLLTREDVARYALATGKVYDRMCDEEDCGHLIQPAEIVTVTKWSKRTDGLTFLAPIAKRIRCAECENRIHPPKEEVSVRGAGRAATKLSKEEASKVVINPVIRRAVLSLVKKFGKLTMIDLLTKLKRKKAIRDLKANEVKRTLRGMKKVKLLRFTDKQWQLPPEKRVSKKSKKKLVKR